MHEPFAKAEVCLLGEPFVKCPLGEPFAKVERDESFVKVEVCPLGEPFVKVEELFCQSGGVSIR